MTEEKMKADLANVRGKIDILQKNIVEGREQLIGLRSIAAFLASRLEMEPVAEEDASDEPTEEAVETETAAVTE